MKLSLLLDELSKMTIDTYNKKIISSIMELSKPIYDHVEFNNVYECTIKIRTSKGGYNDFTILSTKNGRDLKKIVAKELNVNKSKIKLYYVTKGTAFIGDIIFVDGRIGKLLIDDQQLYRQHISKTAFFEMCN